MSNGLTYELGKMQVRMIRTYVLLAILYQTMCSVVKSNLHSGAFQFGGESPYCPTSQHPACVAGARLYSARGGPVGGLSWAISAMRMGRFGVVKLRPGAGRRLRLIFGGS